MSSVYRHVRSRFRRAIIGHRHQKQTTAPTGGAGKVWMLPRGLAEGRRDPLLKLFVAETRDTLTQHAGCAQSEVSLPPALIGNFKGTTGREEHFTHLLQTSGTSG